MLGSIQEEHRARRPTFQEFLACVLLEECFMLDRFVKIIDHELEHGLNLFFRVARVVSKSCVLNQSTSVNIVTEKCHLMNIPIRLVQG